MELMEKYMEKQGTLGYLHKANRTWECDVLAYGTEGTEPEFYFCMKHRTEETLSHWGKTGELLIKTFNVATGQIDTHIVHPIQVVLLRPEETYFRKMYPQEPRE